MPALKETRLFARDTLIRWGMMAEPHLAAYLKKRGPETKARLDYLDERIRHWEKQNWRYAATHLTRIPLEKEDTLAALDQLKDIGQIMRCMNMKKLSDADTASLCRIMTRRGWRSLDDEILAALKKGSASVIKKHLAEEQAALPEAVKNTRDHLGGTVRSRYAMIYWRSKAVADNIRGGIAALKAME